MGRKKHPPLKECKEIIWQELQCMKGYYMTYFPLPEDDCFVLETMSLQLHPIALQKIKNETGMSLEFAGLDNGKISIFFCRPRLATDKEHGEWLKALDKDER